MAPLLECRDVTKVFDGLIALAQVRLELEPGDILGVIGPNGAGKTTLFNVISGFVRPTSGKVFYNGKEITGLGSNKICHLGIARTYQLVRPLASLTTLENVLVGASFGRDRLLPFRQRVARAREELDFVGLHERADEPAANLTLLDKKRLEIARGLATGPKLLLLDEMVAGLTASEVLNIIATVRDIRKRGIAVIMIEHVLKVVMELCRTVMVLNCGSTIAYGSPGEVVNNPRVIEAYLGTSDSLHRGAGARV